MGKTIDLAGVKIPVLDAELVESPADAAAALGESGAGPGIAGLKEDRFQLPIRDRPPKQLTRPRVLSRARVGAYVQLT